MKIEAALFACTLMLPALANCSVITVSTWPASALITPEKWMEASLWLFALRMYPC